ncbi:hypothetical protein PHLCEN_2v11931 [Hermanssonia centrifuga]|uniref:Uncharacterized protein n=1 Tax=Hermanssonia centrifuga TaxID=98765 RepID=A0A2R6NJL6_9APHY|nr:hypothetical protein PHLCEN_2v11931 [Hermanssonia centrifuga]
MPPCNQRKLPLLAPLPRMQTRHGNKDAHPGQPDLPQSRQSSAVVQAEKSVKAHQEAIQRADQNQRMQAVADIEDLQDRENVEADHVANRPPPPADLPPRTKRNIAPLKNKISATEEHAQLPVKSEDSSDEYDPDTEGSDEDLVELDREEMHAPVKKCSRHKKMGHSDVMAARSFTSGIQRHASGKRKESFSTSQDDQQM